MWWAPPKRHFFLTPPLTMHKRPRHLSVTSAAFGRSAMSSVIPRSWPWTPGSSPRTRIGGRATVQHSSNSTSQVSSRLSQVFSRLSQSQFKAISNQFKVKQIKSVQVMVNYTNMVGSRLVNQKAQLKVNNLISRIWFDNKLSQYFKVK